MSFTPSGDQSVSIDINAEDNASGAFESAGESAMNMKDAVGAAGGVLAGLGVAAFGEATKAAVSFEKAMADVEKVTSAETAKALEDDIKDLATEIPLAQEQLATLATQAGRMGAEGTEEIRNFTKIAGQMGAATTLSAKEAGTALGKMSAALGEPLGNVGKLGDAINEVSNNFQATSEEIVDSAQRSGQAMSTLGLTSQEIIGLSGAFNEVSPTSRRAAMRMKQVSEAMMNPDNVGLFADMLGVSADEFKRMREESPEETMMSLMDAVDGNKQAMNILNEELTKSQARAFRDTASSADTMRAAMEKSGEAMENGGSLAGEVATETSTMAGKMKLLKSELNNVAIAMGNAFLPILVDIVETVAPMVSAFADVNRKLDGMPAVVTAATAAIGGLTIALTMMTGVAATTILPIIAGVAALGAAAYALNKAWQSNMGGIQQAADRMWKKVKPAIAAVESIGRRVFEEYMMPMIVRLRKVWDNQFAMILSDVVETMGVMGGRVSKVLGFLETFWKNHGDSVMRVVETAFAFLELTIGTVMRAISANIRVILALIRGDFGEALGIIKTFWTKTFGDILGFLKNDFFQGIKALFTAYFGFIKQIFGAIYRFLIGNSIVPDTFNAIVAFVGGALKDLTKKFLGFFSKMKTVWVNGLLAVTQWLGSTGRSAFTSAFKLVADGVFAVVDRIVDYIREGISGVTSWMLTAIGDAVDSAVERFNNALPDTLEIPSLSIGGQDLDIPTVEIDNPAGDDWEIGGGELSIPSAGVGGTSLDIPELASGGIATGDTLARIGEAGQSEAVVPLNKLSRFLDTAYEVGADTVSPTSAGASNGPQSEMSATLRVDGDGDLAELIREHAELVVEENEESKRARIARS